MPTVPVHILEKVESLLLCHCHVSLWKKSSTLLSSRNVNSTETLPSLALVVVGGRVLECPYLGDYPWTENETLKAVDIPDALSQWSF
jgi:hypothetical protein